MTELYEFKREDAFRFARAINAVAHEHGNELKFKYCPYCRGGSHHDVNTFSISLESGSWNCKRGSCGKTGNMITLAQDFAEFSLGDGIDDYYQRRERYRKFIRKAPIESKDEAVQYLQSRGIPEEITRKYEITMKEGADHIMVFPFIDEKDSLWFIKYRNLDFKKDKKGSKEWCETDRKPILFGMNHCNFENPVLVMTEGQIDSLSCAAAGIENTVSVPFGKNGFTWVPYCWNFLGRFNELIVFGDYENGEISLLEEMKTRFNGTIKHVRPEDYRDCKDANEILVKYGTAAVRQCIENAEIIEVPGIKRMIDIQRVKLSDIESMDTGIKAIDTKCRFYFGELIVLTGAAGDGKSTMASQWATMAINQGYPTMIYSGEMPSWLVRNWVDFQIAGRHNLNDQDDITDETYEAMTKWPMYSKLYISENDDVDTTQEDLLGKFEKGIQQYGIRFLMIDNLMTAMDYDGELELNNAQTAFTKKLANMAQKHNIIIVLIVHPRKSKGASFSNDDIGGSSNIVNRAHKTIRYSRPDKPFTDPDGYEWQKDELYDCPYRFLTVLKDRLTGRTITQGILLDFEESTKRITDKTGKDRFGWKLNWEKDGTSTDGFIEVENLDEIPF